VWLSPSTLSARILPLPWPEKTWFADKNVSNVVPQRRQQGVGEGQTRHFVVQTHLLPIWPCLDQVCIGAPERTWTWVFHHLNQWFQDRVANIELSLAQMQ
jgi:hypothetical protein